MIPGMQTTTGSYFNFNAPRDSPIEIYDIANALSNICRFTGHTLQFYSVAQHSVLVSQAVPREHAFAALMHDAHEAFVGDVSAPLKTMLPDYLTIEMRVAWVVRRRFGLPVDLPDSVKRADLVLLATERRDLMPNTGGQWPCLHGIDPLPERIKPLSPIMAHGLFLNRFRELRPKAIAA